MLVRGIGRSVLSLFAPSRTRALYMYWSTHIGMEPRSNPNTKVVTNAKKTIRNRNALKSSSRMITKIEFLRSLAIQRNNPYRSSSCRPWRNNTCLDMRSWVRRQNTTRSAWSHCSKRYILFSFSKCGAVIIDPVGEVRRLGWSQHPFEISLL